MSEPPLPFPSLSSFPSLSPSLLSPFPASLPLEPLPTRSSIWAKLTTRTGNYVRSMELARQLQAEEDELAAHLERTHIQERERGTPIRPSVDQTTPRARPPTLPSSASFPPPPPPASSSNANGVGRAPPQHPLPAAARSRASTTTPRASTTTGPPQTPLVSVSKISPAAAKQKRNSKDGCVVM